MGIYRLEKCVKYKICQRNKINSNIKICKVKITNKILYINCFYWLQLFLFIIIIIIGEQILLILWSTKVLLILLLDRYNIIIINKLINTYKFIKVIDQYY